MGVKEDFFQWALGDGVKTLQNRLDVSAIQEKYNSKAERILKIDINDIATPPVFIQVKDGNILQLPEHPDPDVSVTFKHLSTFIDMIFQLNALERIFAYEGRVLKRGVLVKEVWFEGDWLSGSIILQRIFQEYVHVLREILKSSKFFRVVVMPGARIKRAVSRS